MDLTAAQIAAARSDLMPFERLELAIARVARDAAEAGLLTDVWRAIPDADSIMGG